MTIRSQLEEIRKRLFISSLLAWLLFATSGIFMGMIHPFFRILSVIAFIVFMFTIFRLLFSLRCPRCRNNLGYVVCWPPTLSPAKISPKIKLCPFCGVDIDSEIK